MRGPQPWWTAGGRPREEGRVARLRQHFFFQVLQPIRIAFQQREVAVHDGVHQRVEQEADVVLAQQRTLRLQTAADGGKGVAVE